MATHSSILAWRIPGTEEPGGLHPWDHKESDMTEQLTRSLSLHCVLSTGAKCFTRSNSFGPLTAPRCGDYFTDGGTEAQRK